MTETSDRASIEVNVDAGTAFDVFTGEIDAWWARGPWTFIDGGRATGKRFEPGVGGRYLELYGDDEPREIGRITVWEPGSRLSYVNTVEGNESDIWFQPNRGDSTTVVIEQRATGDQPRNASYFQSGWTDTVLCWYANWIRRPDRHTATPTEIPRLSPVLNYADVAGAVDWLVTVFGLTRRTLIRGRHAAMAELTLGDSVLLLRQLDGDPIQHELATHRVWAYVDDLEAHLAVATAGGATILAGPTHRGDYYYAARDLEGHQWTFAQARPPMLR